MLLGCGTVANKDKQDASVADTRVIDTSMDGATCATNPIGLGGRWRGEMNLNDDLGNYTAVQAGSSLSYVTGRHGLGMLLGATTAITINDGDTLWPSGSFSLEIWIRGTTDAADLFVKYACGGMCPTNNASALYNLHLNSGGVPTFAFRADDDAGTGATVVDTLHHVNDGNWHHLVGVRDVAAMTGTLYVDGALGASINITPLQAGPMTNKDHEVDLITIGGSIAAGTNTITSYWGGAIDEVSYYSTALTAQQVTAIYNAPDGECH
jgi:hypothetical protein